MIENIIGHESTKKQLEIAIKSANERNKNIPHILFSGVAGCGKTTMAMEMAKAASVDFLAVSPDDFSDRDVVMNILERLDHTNFDKYGNRTGTIRPTMLFIDEIHRMPRKGQEIMGIAMEKFTLETGKKNKFYWMPYFTIIGATTDDGELTKPFREKFKLRFLFDTYSEGEMSDIARLHANRKNLLITAKATRVIAQRSRGIPRLCVSYLERAHDYQRYIGADVITSTAVEETFKHMGIDQKGLTHVERRVLQVLARNKEPIGIDNLAIISNESPKNLKYTIEPYLIRLGFIVRTGKGRTITEAGLKYLGQTGDESLNKVNIEAGYVRK